MAIINVVKEEPISMAELKEELTDIKKRDKELNFRSNKTDDYLSQFTKVKDIKELVKKIDKLQIPRLKIYHIIKIADLMPKTLNELKTLLQGYTITVNNENLNKIIEILQKYE